MSVKVRQRGPQVTAAEAELCLRHIRKSPDHRAHALRLKRYITLLEEQRDKALEAAAASKAEAAQLEVTSGERVLVAEYVAKLDSLTGLYNQHTFQEEIVRGFVYEKCRDRRNLEEISLENDMAALWVADIKGMRIINNTVSHLAGDELVRRMAHLLKTEIRLRNKPLLPILGEREVPGNYGRWGGDEFGVLQPTVRSHTEAYVAASRVRSKYRDESNWGEWHEEVSRRFPDVRIGIVCLELNSIRPQKDWGNSEAKGWAESESRHIMLAWIAAADEAMRYVKEEKLAHNHIVVVEYDRKNRCLREVPKTGGGRLLQMALV